MTTFTTEDRLSAEYESHPTKTINDATGNTYASVIDLGTTVRIQLHPNLVDRTKFINIDKRAVAELISILTDYTFPKYQD